MNLSERLWAERECARQFRLFGGRHRRYYGIVLGILAFSVLQSWRLGQLQRLGFAVLQWIDDLLDGDRASERDPAIVVRELQAAMISGDLDRRDPLHRLMAAYLEDLDAVAPGEGRRETDVVIEAMLADRDRVVQKLALSVDALRTQHHRTFTPSVNLLLIASGSRVRAQDCPEVINLFAWCSTVRDLDEDLAKGLLNLPASLLPDPLPAPKHWPAFAQVPQVKTWLRGEDQKARELIEVCHRRIPRLADRRGRAVIRIYVRSMTQYLGRY